MNEFSFRLKARFRQFKGVSGREKPDLIVSLTSFSARFSTLYVTLESLLSQTVKPDRLLLYIAHHEINSLPNSVLRLRKRGLSILPCDDIRSYKKIIFALESFPDSTIVTADDDVIYPDTWLESLVKAHSETPGKVICTRGRLITFDDKAKINKYCYWPLLDEEMSSFLVVPIGVGGILYPSGSLHNSVLSREIFQSLCPFGDDLWLKAMAIMNGTEARHIDTYKYHFQVVSGSQNSALQDENLSWRNDSQIEKLLEHFKFIERLRNNNT